MCDLLVDFFSGEDTPCAARARWIPEAVDFCRRGANDIIVGRGFGASGAILALCFLDGGFRGWRCCVYMDRGELCISLRVSPRVKSIYKREGEAAALCVRDEFLARKLRSRMGFL